MKNGKKIWNLVKEYKENKISFKVLNRTRALKILIIIQIKKPSKSTILHLHCPLKRVVYMYLGFSILGKMSGSEASQRKSETSVQEEIYMLYSSQKDHFSNKYCICNTMNKKLE